MAIIYGTGFKPLSPKHSDFEERGKEALEHGLNIFLRVAIAVGFIALSFIPVLGEAAGVEAIVETAEEAALAVALEESGEAALEASGVLESVAQSGEDISEVASETGQTVRIGQTIKGSLALGLGEATVNAGLDYREGVFTPLNEAINFGLALTPLIGMRNGKRLANMRLMKQAEIRILDLESALRNTTDSATRREIETRIAQLKNIKLHRSAKMYGARMSSIDVGEVKKITREEISRIIETSGKDSPITVKKISKDVLKILNKDERTFTKNEVRKVVRNTTKNMNLNIKEGLTVHALVKSKHYNRILKTAQFADPSLATRKAWTGAAHFLSTDANILIRDSKGRLKMFASVSEHSKSKVIIGGSKLNLGYYKKFGKALSKKWREFGKTIYKSSFHHVIPVMSKWIEGYRLIETGIPGEYIMIIFFKASKNGIIKEPIIINPISLLGVERFAKGEGYENSVGSYYINEFALARNGSNQTFSGGISNLLNLIPLGEARALLAIPSAIERVARKLNSGKYFTNFIRDITETSNRLWSHKVGKVIAGRWGIAVARGFQSTHNGHTVYGRKAFDFRHIIEEMGVVTLDKARSVQRKAGIMGRTHIIGARRLKNTYQRGIKLGTFGNIKWSNSSGIKIIK